MIDVEMTLLRSQGMSLRNWETDDIRDPRLSHLNGSLLCFIHKFELHVVIADSEVVSVVSAARCVVLSCICAMIRGPLCQAVRFPSTL
jgi:hypothetical protein